jgi:hypothetical protein
LLLQHLEDVSGRLQGALRCTSSADTSCSSSSTASYQSIYTTQHLQLRTYTWLSNRTNTASTAYPACTIYHTPTSHPRNPFTSSELVLCRAQCFGRCRTGTFRVGIMAVKAYLYRSTLLPRMPVLLLCSFDDDTRRVSDVPGMNDGKFEVENAGHLILKSRRISDTENILYSTLFPIL